MCKTLQYVLRACNNIRFTGLWYYSMHDEPPQGKDKHLNQNQIQQRKRLLQIN